MPEVQAPAITISTHGFRLLAFNVIGHPLDYVRFLIQIGHEPIPPYPASTLFGRTVMRLPSVIKYIEYIKNKDGWLGLYRGMFPKVLGHIVGSGAAVSSTQHLELTGGRSLMDDPLLSEQERLLRMKLFFLSPFPFSCYSIFEQLISDEESLDSKFDEWQFLLRLVDSNDCARLVGRLKLNYLILSLKKSVVERTVFITVSQPFIVISARMMASFVGGEEAYRGFFSSIEQIFHEDGILGFFSGLFPRLLGDISAAVISTLVIYSLNNYVVHDKSVQTLTTTATVYYINSQAHPLTVVSSCMSINNTSLQAGKPPNMLTYDSWLSCWRHLRINNQLNRGASLFFRPYNGPPSKP